MREGARGRDRLKVPSSLKQKAFSKMYIVSALLLQRNRTGAGDLLFYGWAFGFAFLRFFSSSFFSSGVGIFFLISYFSFNAL